MPLSMASSGSPVIIRNVSGKEETRRFLATLGFTEGAQATIVSETSGNLIVKIKDSRVAISRAMAMRISVA